MNTDLYIEIKFHNVEEALFEIKSNVKPEHRIDLIKGVLDSLPEKEADKRKPIEQEIYTIQMQWDLADDNCRLTSDTGNRSLTLGVLYHVIEFLKNEEQADKQGGI